MTTLTPAQIAAYAKLGGFSGGQVVIMTAIALGESGGRTDATHRNSNGSVDKGVWQINDPANADILATGNWADPVDNARMAHAVFVRQGYSAWSVYNSRAFRDHLAEATRGVSGAAAVTLPTATGGAPNPVDALDNLTNPHTWLRVAMFIGGVTLTMVALAMIGWNNTPDGVKKAAKEVAKVVVTKKL